MLLPVGDQLEHLAFAGAQGRGVGLGAAADLAGQPGGQARARRRRGPSRSSSTAFDELACGSTPWAGSRPHRPAARGRRSPTRRARRPAAPGSAARRAPPRRPPLRRPSRASGSPAARPAGCVSRIALERRHAVVGLGHHVDLAAGRPARGPRRRETSGGRHPPPPAPSRRSFRSPRNQLGTAARSLSSDWGTSDSPAPPTGQPTDRGGALQHS